VLFNYAMGVTGVKFWHFALGGLGMIPGVTAYVYFGTAISNMADVLSGNYEGGWVQLVIIIVGSVLAVAVIIYVTWAAR
jgi:uncharacterized membrane protein YdjX (TVP38/TMEM64 family)